ncbi:hypothetical protein [Thioalkalivibrio paradoxus]|uniref:Translation initiation factor 2 n=1 Tax=Thioalkalivibrio paradoxus ARh 1 TaxID=713585 RepID=W0DSV9_9GAMM|nr:hypothetical protein [Thioalkalivibrio paradoxus]AHE99955.1 hypothetical protein THITH_04890 [Thioalkalivibrio paradoxus ARh 1]
MSEFDYRNDARHVDPDEYDVRSRRLQLIVYSSLVAFVVLAVYGFWLITSLTRDVSRLAIEMSAMTRTIDREMTVMAAKMGDIDERMVYINENMVSMNENMLAMNRNIASMTRDIGTMNVNIRSMSSDTKTMAGSTLHMQRDMWSLNRNVSGPLGMMNSFNPFSGNPGPFPGSPAPFFPQH